MVKKGAKAKPKNTANHKDNNDENEDENSVDVVPDSSIKVITSPNKKIINKELKENNIEVKETKIENQKEQIITESPKKIILQPTTSVKDLNTEIVDNKQIEHSDEKKAEIQEGINILINEEIDNRSIYIKNVDFSATPEDLEEHFKSLGAVNRITIICDKYTGIPKGYIKHINKIIDMHM
jgi:RNA recognition motif-containing protein